MPVNMKQRQLFLAGAIKSESHPACDAPAS
jgi:hypothetical protein